MLEFLGANSDQLALLGEVALAMLLGGLIGAEREAADRPAGFRTHMMIAGAAALLVGLGEALVENFDATPAGDGVIRADPIRLVEAVVAAVGFIAGGSILKSARDKSVQGLTTASALLLSAAVGVGVSVGQYVLAIGAVVLALFVLYLLRRVEQWIQGREGK